MYLLWRKQGIQLIFNSRNGFTIQGIGEIETRLIRVNGWLKFQFLSQVALASWAGGWKCIYRDASYFGTGRCSFRAVLRQTLRDSR